MMMQASGVDAGEPKFLKSFAASSGTAQPGIFGETTTVKFNKSTFGGAIEARATGDVKERTFMVQRYD